MARLEQAYRGDPAQPALVFVHGLNGDLFDTWVGPGASRDDCWLHWVGEDTGCDTWTLAYDALLSRWQGQAMALPNQASQVVNLLAVHPGLEGRSLVLVGHSMGGLVIKTFITQTHSAGDEKARALVGRIRGLVFLATPHQGSQLASLARALGSLRANAQVGDMGLHDAHLLQIGTAFRAQWRALRLKVAAFAEDRDVVWERKGWWGLWTRQVGVRVVDRSSGDPALEGVNTVYLAEDHFSICKPSSRDAQIHHALVAFVRQDILAGPPAAAATPAMPLPRRLPGQLGGSLDARLEPAEGRFYGRDDEVARVLSFLAGTGEGAAVTSREVSGVGGIGKTEVCKAALRLWLAGKPGQAAWFVPVADGAGLAWLVSRLAGMVGRPDLQTAEQLLEALPPGLYYLDNLESVAAADDGATFLRAMQQLPDVRLLVSSRYSLPRVLGTSIAIGVLPRDAALRLFSELWLGHDPLPAGDALADFVVGDLGCHALSVALAARLGDCHAYPDLVRRWRAVGTALLAQPGEAGRQGSLPASLRLTAEALGRTPGALDLWTVLALFATGASDAVLGELEQRGGWVDARRALVRHHVVARQADGRWTMLPPLARYALGASLDRTDGFDWSTARPAVRMMFMAQAKGADSIRSTAAALDARAWLLAHFESLADLLEQEMRDAVPDVDWLQKLHDHLVNLYQFRVAMAVDLLHRLSGILARPASAMKVLGDLESLLGRLDEARTLYGQALARHEQEDPGLGPANVLKALGDLEYRLDHLDEARRLYGQALARYEQARSQAGQAQVLKALGDLEYRLDELAEARRLYDRALVLFEREDDGLGQAYSLKALGDLEGQLREEAKARELYDRALKQFEREQDDLGQANTLQVMADLIRLGGDPAEASRVYHRALHFYAREQEPIGLAYTHAELARCAHAMGQDAERDRSLLQALHFGSRSGTARVTRYVQDSVEELMGGPEQALAWLALQATQGP